VLALTLLLALAAAPRVTQAPLTYERRELRIPMRDGVTLGAVALVPTDTSRAYPFILQRTPFSAGNIVRGNTIPPQYREMAEDGYIIVVEDIRGRFSSEGDFVSLRGQRDPYSPKGVNESTDAYDTVEWLLGNVAHNNGRIGVIGMSYPGLLAGLAGVNPHPAIRAISPQAPMADAWMGDDFFHQGAFRQTQGVTYGQIIETNPKGLTFPDTEIPDQYAWYLQFPTLDSLARAAKVHQLPLWRAFVEHPRWDRWWQERSLPRLFTAPVVPTLTVGGYWDSEDMYGPQALYRTLEKQDRKGWNHLVLGPWPHGGWQSGAGDSLGPLGFGSATAAHFRQQIQRPWFAHYLHGAGKKAFPEAWVFETNGAGWKAFDAWPPKNTRTRRLYFQVDGRLSFDAPKSAGQGYDSFTSDPANPVPFVPRPVTDDVWRSWMLLDQHFTAGRADVKRWQTEPLTEDLVIAGDVIARLTASTTGSDADWVVKLIDVYPDSPAGALAGYELMVNGDIMRGRYWKSFTTPTAIPVNTPTRFTVDLHQQLYRFRKGHRIMVQVQSSWFPLYDRNPQTFVPTIFAAPASSYQAQEHRIWRTPSSPSFLELPVLP
jgi:hypothetical protein